MRASFSRLSPVLALCIVAATLRAETKPTAADVSLDIYAEPAQRVDIGDGRRLNLRCSGNGAPTVLLEAGFGADSMAWAKLQPLLARRQRVCAYDRAGYGYSDGGRLPRTIDAEADDLHALIAAARIETPLILVGHSLGTNIVRRYDERHGADVAALVLLDPPPQHIEEFSPAFAKADDAGATAQLAAYRRCTQGAEKKQLDAPPPELQACLRGPNPAWSEKLNAAVHGYHARPAFWHAVASEAEHKIALLDAPVSPNERHADKPVLVLTAVDAYADADAADRKALQAAQDKTHALIAATSKLGERIRVEHSSHEIQNDQLEAVITAVTKAGEARASAPGH